MPQAPLAFDDLPPTEQRERLAALEAAYRIAGLASSLETSPASLAAVQASGVPIDPAWVGAVPERAPKAPATLERELDFDLIGVAAAVFAAREERLRAPRGETLHASMVQDPALYATPWVDLLATWLLERFAERAVSDSRLSARIMPWPRGDWAICVTSDADEIRWSWRRKLLVALTRPWRLLGPNAYWNVPALAARLEAAGIRGTFYVGFRGQRRPHDIQYDADQIATTLVELVEAGHEVGLHGSLGTARDLLLLQQQRDRLTAIIGKQVQTTRQHFLDFVPGHTWGIQEKAGFSGDSTAQIRGMNGFKHGTAHPFRVSSSLLELPPTIMDVYLHRAGTPVSAALAEARRLSAKVKTMGGALVLNWHNEWYDAIGRPEYVASLESLLSEPEAEVFSATVQETVAWWASRERIQIEERDDGVVVRGAAGCRFQLELLGAWGAGPFYCQGGAIEKTGAGPHGRPVVQVHATDDPFTIRLR